MLNKKRFAILLFVTFIIRAATFYFFVAPNEYYRQPDSGDYHNGALCIAAGNGMTHLGKQEPIFWRTPGYPWYLSWFYSWHGLRSGDFNANRAAQTAALWVQIVLSCSRLICL